MKSANNTKNAHTDVAAPATKPPLAQETPRLTSGQFKRFSDLVYRQCGIHLTNDKEALLNARIAKRLRILGVQADQYFHIVSRNRTEMNRFVDAVSTNHTFFFREAQSFRILQPHCRRIWCAAASSGEEPYSIAAYCYDSGFKPTILATDISESCLEKAGSGIYPLQSAKHIPGRILRKCFQKGKNQWDGHMRVRPEIRRMVHFERFNLVRDTAPQDRFDAIFCRNVMIYFDTQTKENVVAMLCSILEPNGHFVIGGAESLNNLNHRLTYVQPSVYQKN
jgi:chemotaxis protein methyltransferase CheR